MRYGGRIISLPPSSPPLPCFLSIIMARRDLLLLSVPTHTHTGGTSREPEEKVEGKKRVTSSIRGGEEGPIPCSMMVLLRHQFPRPAAIQPGPEERPEPVWYGTRITKQAAGLYKCVYRDTGRLFTYLIDGNVFSPPPDFAFLLRLSLDRVTLRIADHLQGRFCVQAPPLAPSNTLSPLTLPLALIAVR